VIRTLRLEDLVQPVANFFLEQATIGECLHEFAENQLIEAPVVDFSFRLLGLCKADDLFRALDREANLAETITTIMRECPQRCAGDIISEDWAPDSDYYIVDNSGTLVGIMRKDDLYEARQEMNERFLTEANAIIDSVFDGIFVIDIDGLIVRTNAAYHKISGWSRQDLIGLQIQDMVTHGMISQSVSMLALERNEPVTVKQTFKHGRIGITSANFIRDKSGKLVGVVCSVRDITELTNLKGELEQTRRLSERYKEELLQLRQQRKFEHIISKSKQMEQVLLLVQRVAEVDSTVLILGESGVGKGVLAEAIHRASQRSEGPFIKVNCAALPEPLLESELFGYTSGSFTGARKQGKPGRFELAQGGTIFLDEISELPVSLQAKLLQATQDKEIVPLGGTKPIKLDVRILAATNKDLAEMVKKGNFREDLFYRLHVVPITIPPLRERREDILPLISHFLEQCCQKYKRHKVMHPSTVEYLLRYDWPGNVRELQNVIENLVVLCLEETILPDDLPAELKPSPAFAPYYQGTSILSKLLEEFEKNAITAALATSKNAKEAAKKLGISPATMCRKVKRYKIS
jgi:PAS domain S-box-containing protein